MNHHLGQDGRGWARGNIEAWSEELEEAGLDAIVINASGCATAVKDYGFLFRDDPKLAQKAQVIASLARDVSEVMSEIGLRSQVTPTGRRVAYHSACSLQHGQRVRSQPKELLKQAGFIVVDARRSSLLRFGRYLQPAPAGARQQATRS
ncbi:hypothetical protein ACRQ5Q_08865 [Bradyrhizobium sp. PMVTL-01]|uniref:hypothetical protein n=1 Tax=Bradyrhizobium sp. PMVTL-01 TaxID=3434999 RepID=UPI003F6EED26